MKNYGAIYSTTYNFGEILSVFEVEPDWQGFRFHGYCTPSAREVAEFFSNNNPDVDAMYESGFAHGKQHAIEMAFGHKVECPYFETPEEQHDWYEGFQCGLDSVND